MRWATKGGEDIGGWSVERYDMWSAKGDSVEGNDAKDSGKDGRYKQKSKEGEQYNGSCEQEEGRAYRWKTQNERFHFNDFSEMQEMYKASR